MTQHPQLTHATNDNSEDDPMPFIQLSALVANVMEFLKVAQEQKEQGKRDSGSGSADQKDSRSQCEQINQRLDELIPLERRARIKG